MSPEQSTVHAQRQSVYGPFAANMAGTSQQLSGLITQMLANKQATYEGGVFTLPPWATPLFMVAVKLNRAASGQHHTDNGVDAGVYFDMALRMQRESADNKPDWGG
jgi:hypothetical protein